MTESFEEIWNSKQPGRLERVAGVVHGWKDWEDVPVDETLSLLRQGAAEPEPDLAGDGTEHPSDDTPEVSRQRREDEVILGRWVQLQADSPREWTDEELDQLVQYYLSTPQSASARNLILTLLALVGTHSARTRWINLICDDPPGYRPTLPMAFLTVVRNPDWLTDDVFGPLLTRAIQHVPVAAAVLDMANFAFRRGLRQEHPCRPRAAELTELLARLVEQMERVEEGELAGQMSPEQLSQTVNDAVALIVALVDALALMNHEPAIGKLHRVLKLRHRRLKVEAAAALARMGDETGRDVLIALAEFPSIRQRVLAYARELGIEKEISLEWQGDIATAESHLAMWLAEPSQMGIAPSTMKLIDQRRLSWPGEESPVDCYLFQFEYGSQGYANIGMSGPLVHAFSADLRVLARRDQYAAFAGWQAEHAEIFTLPYDRARGKIPNVVGQLEQALAASEFENAEPVAVGGFFSEYQLVATAEFEGQRGTCIITDKQADWIGEGNPAAPIDWRLALEIWRGRRLLEQFNPDESFD